MSYSERIQTATGRWGAMGATTIVIVGDRDVARFRGWLIEDMVAARHRVVVCGPAEAKLAGAITDLGAEYIPIPLDQKGMNPIRDIVDTVRLAWVIRRAGANVALSHSTKQNVLGPVAAKLAGVRERYAMIEGLGYAFAGGTELKRRFLRTVVGLALRTSLRLCPAIFVLNEEDEQVVRAAGLVGSGQRVVRINGTGIDLSEYAYAPMPEGPPVFLLIGRLMREKGIFEFIEAARRLKPRFQACRFQILGPEDSNPGAVSRRQLADWLADGVVEYPGKTDDVRPFLRSCTTFVLPSYREGMPRTIMEAMAIGRPIVTTDVAGCRDTTVDKVNGFVVPPRDSAALAFAMQKLIKDPSLGIRMGAASRAIAEKRFDVKKVNAEVLRTMNLRYA